MSKALHKIIYQAQHMGRLDRKRKEVVYGRAGSAGLRDVVDIYLCIQNNRITEVKFQAYGTAATLACAVRLTELIHRQSLLVAQQQTYQLLMTDLELPNTAFSSALLAIDALQSALQNHTNHS